MNSIFTIGFTQKSAKEFFRILTTHHIKLIADVRLNNTNQLAGFTRKNDLQYFSSLHGIGYEHWTDFSPVKELRDLWLKDENWKAYEKGYKELLKKRKAVESLKAVKLKQPVVLLCAESDPDFCHRKIAAEAIKKHFKLDNVIHL